MITSRTRQVVRLAIPVLTACIFFLDWLTPLGVVDWVLYFIPLLLSFYASPRFLPIILATIFSVLTVMGFFLSPPGLEPGVALINLLLGVGTLWVVAFVVNQLRNTLNENRQLSAAVEQSPVSIAITNLSGEIEYVNPKFCAVTGYSFEEVRGQNPRLLKSGEMPVESYRQMWATITAGETWRGEFHNRKKNGELYWASASISPVKDDQGKVTHFVAVKEDITDRKRAEELVKHAQKELAQNERRHKTILDNLPDNVWLRDREGRYLAVNKAWCEFFGLDESQAIGKTEQDLFPPEVARKFQEITAQLRSSCQPLRLEQKLARRVQGDVWFEVFLAPLLDEQGQFCGTTGIARDITQRKQASVLLLDSQQRLELATRSAQIGIWDWDLVANHKVWDAQMHVLYGIREQDYNDSFAAWQKRLHPDDRDRVVADIQNAQAGSKDYNTEFRVVWPNGEVRYVEAHAIVQRAENGLPTRMIGINRDITKRKCAEQSLRESEEKFHQLADNIHDVFWICSPDFTTMHYVNASYEVIWGRSMESLYAHPHQWIEAILPEERERVFGVFTSLMGATPDVSVEYRITRPDGAIRWIHDRGFQVRDAAGHLIRISGIASDITERKRITQELADRKQNEARARLALEQEQESSRIKSRFVSLVSHEFRTPLSIINMAAELLDGYLDKLTEAERSEHLNEIRSSVGRMTQMMNDFLLHGDCASGKMACQPARVQVEALCRRLIAEMPDYSGSPRAIECAVDPAVGEACLDEKFLGHILGNLLSNAVKYSRAGQPVKLAVKRVYPSPQPNGGPDPVADTHLEFIVSDAGIGIPAADMTKLYQTFHRAPNVGTRPGTGMGLAIVKQFVELHRGTIRVASQEGKGTTFWVELPIDAPAAPAGIHAND